MCMVHRRTCGRRWRPAEAFVPQVHHAAMEGEVDWGEATVVLGGRRLVAQLFFMRLPFRR